MASKTSKLRPRMAPNQRENWKLSESDSFQFNFDLIFQYFAIESIDLRHFRQLIGALSVVENVKSPNV